MDCKVHYLNLTPMRAYKDAFMNTNIDGITKQ